MIVLGVCDWRVFPTFFYLSSPKFLFLILLSFTTVFVILLYNLACDIRPLSWFPKSNILIFKKGHFSFPYFTLISFDIQTVVHNIYNTMTLEVSLLWSMLLAYPSPPKVSSHFTFL